MKKFNPAFLKAILFSVLLMCVALGTEAQYAHADTVTNSYGTFILSNVYNGHVSDYKYYLIMKNAVTGDSCSHDMDFYVGGCYFPCSNDDQYINYDHLNASGFPFDTAIVMPQEGPDSTITVYISGAAYGQPACTGSIVSTTFYLNNANSSSGPPMSATTPYLIGPNLNPLNTVFRAGSGSIYQPVLNWTKQSDVPDSVLTYVIYRAANSSGIGAVAIDTVRGTNVVFGGTHIYQDNTPLQRGDYSYYIEVFISRQHIREVAFSNTQTVTLTNDMMDATHGTYYGRTHITWYNIASFATNDIAIYSNGQQIAVVNRSATSYDDYSGVAGVKYYYTIAPLDSNFNSPFTFSDTGYARPNGVLNGYVRSVYGSGVPNVRVTATGTVDGTVFTYSDSTDATGYYSINNILRYCCHLYGDCVERQ